MRLSFTPDFAPDVDKKVSVVVKFVKELNKYLADKEYGGGLDEIAIIIICVEPYNLRYLKPYHPEYIKNREILEESTGKVVKQNEFLMEIRLDYQEVIKTKKKDFPLYFGEQLLEELKVLYHLKKPIPDFKPRKFRKDIKTFLEIKH